MQGSYSMEEAKRMLEIEQALVRKLGTVGVSSNLLAPEHADGVPVMRICIEGLEELPVFVTGSAQPGAVHLLPVDRG
ncbi:hypothetical protein LP420_38905 [Massilia sp. B-10]|nr:hypothetical protein LP420_38905 [Massilia sp. B-10]